MTVHIEIDRPAGTNHPQHGFLYPLNYGFVPGVPGADGEDLDAYVLGIAYPLSSFTGRCIAVIHRLEEEDDKLILVTEGLDLTDAEILAATRFQEQFFRTTLFRSA